MAKTPKKPPTAEDSILDNIGEQTGDEDIRLKPEESEDNQPVYRVVGDSRIPVSKSRGKFWKSRRDQEIAKRRSSGDLDAWDEAIRYYKGDQSTLRSPRYIGTRGDSGTGNRLSERGRSTENIVFANVTAIVPATYAKNPDCEVTLADQQDEQAQQLATVAKRLVNTLASQKAAPGYNLKPKARKCIVNTMLTNLSYLEVGYNFKENSSEQAVEDLRKLSQELEKAKTTKEQREIEGKLQALESTIDMLRPAGPWVKFRRPQDVLRDTETNGSADLTDSNWVMVRDFISTSYIRAKFTTPDGDQDKSIYKPSHVVALNDQNSVEEEVNTFSLIGQSETYSSYGYSDQESYDKACVTECWYVWDKVTRRIELYNAGDWSWPLWVWDDLYNIDTFYTLVPLEFYTDPEYGTARGEVSYYLDQQDEINDMNDLVAKSRSWARGNIFYNKNMIKDPAIIDKFLLGGDEARAVGIDLPADADITKMIWSMTPPALEHDKVFNKQGLLESIDRLSSVSSAMRGVEYKTNTTNKAIEAYTSQDQTRLDEKTDAIEDMIGEVQWKIMQLLLQFMPKQQVIDCLGPRMGALWNNMKPTEIRQMVDMQVVGGSTLKPTSAAKKKEAITLVQSLGQFAKAGAGASIILALKVLERAFDDFVITTEDWKMLEEAIMSELQRGQSTGAAGPSAGGAPAGGASGAGAPAAAGQQGVPPEAIAKVLAEVTEVINNLPPEVKVGLSKALGSALAKGIPIEEALPRIVQLMTQGGGEQQQQQPAARPN